MREESREVHSPPDNMSSNDASDQPIVGLDQSMLNPPACDDDDEEEEEDDEDDPSENEDDPSEDEDQDDEDDEEKEPSAPKDMSSQR